MSFVHLHVHTQYSILDGLSSIPKLFDRAEELGMPALAITDHGNMYGIKEFFKFAKKHKDENGKYKVKPIIGCEVYVTRHYDHTLKDSDHRKYYHLILLAKNYEGYKNLMKIVSTGHIEGKYYDKPRVSHEVIEKYHSNLICCSACLAGEVPKDIMAGDLDAAREAIRWHKSLFGEDYYLEVMLHKTEVPNLPLDVYEAQRTVNDQIFFLAEEEGVKVVATNDVHFIRKEDGPTHDRLICLTTNANIDDPSRLRYTQQEYLKSEEEMRDLFPNHPEAIETSLEIADKVEVYSIDRNAILPKFDLDPAFLKDVDKYLEEYKEVIEAGKNDKEGNYRGDEFCRSVAYLCYLTYQGAHRNYGENLDNDHLERIDFELKTISRMGFPDYFLIVQDYIAASRRDGWLVGPGRGSAAGSVVAYCLKITNIDPIRYQLLFERFLNPDRINMPDIDVDFENLVAAHEYVEGKYGSDHVSRVITFGTMAAKSAIKDVARISNLSLDESNRLTKLIPDRLSEKVEKEYLYNPKLDQLKPGFKAFEKEVEVDDPDNPGEKKKVMKTFQKGMEETDVKITLKNCYRLVPELKKELEEGTSLNKEVLYYAEKLEGSIRQVGMHACATIIGRGNLTDFIPICLSKDKDTGKDVWTSQYDGHYIEDVGMLKMDFLGLNTLSIIKEALNNIKDRFGKEIDIEKIPIDDPETYELYGRGDTTVIFQFESEGMKTWLQKLHPSRFEDLIAMNALYRPGPMDYIPDFVDRKLGKKPIEYDLPEMEEYLSDTYGITVYQEQVMLLSRKLANFTRGEADTLRKAMGKKLIDVLNSLRDKFMSEGMKNGHPEKTLDKIWKDWEKFAQYAFNKSHATCYAWVSYQTGWLKCHYTAEFLAANLSCNLNNMEEIKKIMADCKTHKIKVLNPDINKSQQRFTVDKEGNIVFGLGGMKGFGSNVVDAIIKEREGNGNFKDIFDFVERVSGQINRKSFESLIYAGAFDSMGYRRSQFFQPVKNGDLFIDAIVRYAELYKRDAMDSSESLFGDVEEMKIARPEMPEFSGEEDSLQYLQREKEIVGMYLSSHPLDRYSFEINQFTTNGLSEISDLLNEAALKDEKKNITVAGIVTKVEKYITKKGSQAANVTVEDYSGTYTFRLFDKTFEMALPYLSEFSHVFMELSLAPRYRLKPEEKAQGKTVDYTEKINGISLLGTLCEKYVRNLVVYIEESRITPTLRKNLHSLLRSNKGPTPLSFLLLNSDNDSSITLKAQKYPVIICPDLLDGMSMLGLKYRVDKK